MASFRADLTTMTDGNVAILAALVIPAVVIAGGMGLDGWRRQATLGAMQEAADAAALASLRRAAEGAEDSEEFGQRVLANARFGAADGAHAAVDVDLSNRKSVVAIDYPLDATLTKIVGVSSFDLKVVSEARIAESGMPICVLALHPTDDKTLAGSGGTAFSAANCRIQVNSSDADSVVLTGGSNIASGENCFVGGVQSGLSDINPAPTPGCGPVPDPFASIAKPAVGPCDETNFSASGIVTLTPGVYCGGIAFSGGATVTYEPGLYIIKDGELSASGGGSFTGDGVSFFLTGNGAGVTLSGGAVVDLRAMMTGPLAGFVFYLDPGAVPLAKSHISGGGDVHYEGVFYFPNQELVMSGGGGVASPSAFVAYVADRFTYTGGSSLSVNYDEALTTRPIPPGLRRGGEIFLAR